MFSQRDWAHNFFLPTLLLTVIGGMTWAVRGCSGYGASAGCIFAGVMLGAAWWFLAGASREANRRPYTSGWIILAMTVAFGVAGNRGWMQWPYFFNNILYTNYATGEYVPIARIHGFIWLFIAGVPWAGLGACLIAWCNNTQRTTPAQWITRFACGVFMAYFLAVVLYDRFPSVFLPLYDSLKDKYQNLDQYRSLWKLVRDNREAMVQLGLYLGFLLYEIFQRNTKNVTLILTVGLLNGLGWALLQNWMWAGLFWPSAQFNFWRCWETSGGLSIGLAFGVAFLLVNRPSEHPLPETAAPHQPITAGWLAAFLFSILILARIAAPEIMPNWTSVLLAITAAAFAIACYRFARANRQSETHDPEAWSVASPCLERWGAYTGLILGLGLSIQNGLKGWANIYLGQEIAWEAFFFFITGPIMILALAAISVYTLLDRRPASPREHVFPRAYALIWTVVIIQNILAQMITGPFTNWNEVVFNIYYILLFLITAVIIHHYHVIQTFKQSR